MASAVGAQNPAERRGHNATSTKPSCRRTTPGRRAPRRRLGAARIGDRAAGARACGRWPRPSFMRTGYRLLYVRRRLASESRAGWWRRPRRSALCRRPRPPAVQPAVGVGKHMRQADNRAIRRSPQANWEVNCAPMDSARANVAHDGCRHGAAGRLCIDGRQPSSFGFAEFERRLPDPADASALSSRTEDCSRARRRVLSVAIDLVAD